MSVLASAHQIAEIDVRMAALSAKLIGKMIEADPETRSELNAIRLAVEEFRAGLRDDIQLMTGWATEAAGAGA